MKIPMAFRADNAKVSIRLRISFNFPKSTILYKSKDSATVSASIAEGGNLGNRSFRTCMNPALKVEEIMA